MHSILLNTTGNGMFYFSLLLFRSAKDFASASDKVWPHFAGTVPQVNSQEYILFCLKVSCFSSIFIFFQFLLPLPQVSCTCTLPTLTTSLPGTWKTFWGHAKMMKIYLLIKHYLDWRVLLHSLFRMFSSELPSNIKTGTDRERNHKKGEGDKIHERKWSSICI